MVSFEISQIENFWIFRIAIFLNFTYWKFMEFYELEIICILKIKKLIDFKDFTIWK